MGCSYSSGLAAARSAGTKSIGGLHRLNVHPVRPCQILLLSPQIPNCRHAEKRRKIFKENHRSLASLARSPVRLAAPPVLRRICTYDRDGPKRRSLGCVNPPGCGITQPPALLFDHPRTAVDEKERERVRKYTTVRGGASNLKLFIQGGPSGFELRDFPLQSDTSGCSLGFVDIKTKLMLF